MKIACVLSAKSLKKEKMKIKQKHKKYQLKLGKQKEIRHQLEKFMTALEDTWVTECKNSSNIWWVLYLGK